MTGRFIYKLCSGTEWKAAEAAGVYKGSALDLADGFVHFSTQAQVPETAALHFSKEHDLVLVKVSAESFDEGLKWEPSRGGDLFPHLYGVLPLETVAHVYSLEQDAEGGHQFPDGWKD